MALDDKVLQDFFSRPRRSPKLNETPITTNKEEISTNPSVTENNVNHFRVFDDPITLKNLGQSQDKPQKNLGQSDHKVKTKLGHINPNVAETSDKLKTELRTEPKTNFGQTSDKAGTNEGFTALVGLQRKIVLFVYDECRFSRDKMTRPLSIEYIANSCQTTKLSAQKTIQRLEKKQVILRKGFKNGRGGWTQYELPDLIFQEILQSETSDKLRTNVGQSQDKPKTELKTELRTNVSSSSGINNLYNITTTSDENKNKNLLSEDWSFIDIKPLTEIGFSASHLSQIAQQNKLNPEMVQNSIYGFAYDLKHNNKGLSIKGSPLNYFMGVLRNGQVYVPPENYESPQDEAQRLYLEQKKVQAEKRLKRIQELQELCFDEWLNRQSREVVRNLIPEIYRNTGENSTMVRNHIKQHFLDVVWPTLPESEL